MPHLALDNINLYYEVHGNGTPLLLIAGLASDSQSWQPVIEDLSQNILLITPDNRGTGRTQPQDVETSIHHIASDCIELIDHLNYSFVNVLGHSMGGFVAQDIAIRYPDHVDKLILAGTAALNSNHNNSLFSNWTSYLEAGMDLELWFQNLFYWIFTEDFFKNESAVNEAVRYAIEYPYPQSIKAFKNQVNAMMNYDCTEDLSKIKARTLVINGKEDLLYPPDTCLKLAQAIPHAASSLIDGAAHSIHIEQPQLFVQIVQEFVSNSNNTGRH